MGLFPAKAPSRKVKMRENSNHGLVLRSDTSQSSINTDLRKDFSPRRTRRGTKVLAISKIKNKIAL